ncbi:MAG: hypothetical protein LBU06_05450 [Desulfovibrio sp.]|jgi:hypothetical protein|nr:hypothetical protein [Desulfovibrio sp.]
MASWYNRLLLFSAIFPALCFAVPAEGAAPVAGEAVAQIYRGGTLFLKTDGTVLACGFEWDREMKIKTFDYYNKGYQPLVLPPPPENPVGLLDPAIEKILGARQEENAP